MLSLHLFSGKSNIGQSQMLIDYIDGSVGFTVITEAGTQLDFSVEKDEWKQLKTFIDDAIYEEEHNKKDVQ